VLACLFGVFACGFFAPIPFIYVLTPTLTNFAYVPVPCLSFDSVAREGIYLNLIFSIFAIFLI